MARIMFWNWDKLNGNLVVFGGDVTIEEEALVDGDIAIFGGNIDIDGEVSGDIAAFGGNISLVRIRLSILNFSAMGGTVNKFDSDYKRRYVTLRIGYLIKYR